MASGMAQPVASTCGPAVTAVQYCQSLAEIQALNQEPEISVRIQAGLTGTQVPEVRDVYCWRPTARKLTRRRDAEEEMEEAAPPLRHHHNRT